MPIFYTGFPDDGTARTNQADQPTPPDKPTLQEAMSQFWPEVYLTRADRDAALGMTRVPFCQYITAARETIEEDCLKHVGLGCGYALGHALYEPTLSLLLPAMITKLADDFLEDTWPRIGGAEITIARVNYCAIPPQEDESGMVRCWVEPMPRLGALPPQNHLDATALDLTERISRLMDESYQRRR